MGNEMKKISSGRVRDRGKTWFPQLVDKRKAILKNSITCTYVDL